MLATMKTTLSVNIPSFGGEQEQQVSHPKKGGSVNRNDLDDTTSKMWRKKEYPDNNQFCCGKDVHSANCR